LSVVIPCLNEAGIVRERLARFQSWRHCGRELILVDGGSDDGTPDLARPLVDRVLQSPPGRAHQMNLGASAARGALLWFLHLDTEIPDEADLLVAGLAARERVWGRFDVRLSGGHLLLRGIESLMNTRSRLTGIATGDQAIFVSRDLFWSVGGFPDIPLMEDIAISRALKRRRWPVCLHGPVVTSSRRWERNGILRTVVRMWTLRLAYALGVSPARLSRWYPVCSTREPAS
jgi:rSAM/selenodomain-associated transferase 2